MTEKDRLSILLGEAAIGRVGRLAAAYRWDSMGNQYVSRRAVCGTCVMSVIDEVISGIGYAHYTADHTRPATPDEVLAYLEEYPA